MSVYRFRSRVSLHRLSVTLAGGGWEGKERGAVQRRVTLRTRASRAASVYSVGAGAAKQ
jgi:hypothetical protein